MFRNVPNLRFDDSEWTRSSLGTIANVTKLAGFEFTEYVKYQDQGSIIAIRGLNCKNGRLDLNDVKYIDGSDFSKLKRSKLFIGDILFTYVGTIGETAIIDEDNKYYLAPNVSRIRTNKINPNFLKHYISTDNFYKRIIAPLIATSSQPALSMENIRKFSIGFPSSKSQNKIANFLNIIDKRIDTQNKIINNLVSQKKYIKSIIFNSSNTNHQIGDFLEEYAEKNVNNFEPVSVGKYGIRKRTEVFSRELSKDYSKNKVICKNSLTIGMGTKEIDIAVLFEDANYCVSPAYTTYKIKNINPYYFNELLDNFNYILSLRYMISGARQGKSVNKKELMHHQIFVHTREQQTDIINLLKSIDNKIDNETKLLEKYSLQKNYLLDNLFI